MKKLLLLLTSSLFISSYPKNEINNSSNIWTAKDIIGTWKLATFNVNGTTFGYLNNIQLKRKISSFGKQSNFIFHFSPNYKLNFKGNFTMVTTSTSNGISQTIEQEAKVIQGLNNNTNWFVENNFLNIVDVNGQSFEISIDEFHFDKMILKYTTKHQHNIKGFEFETSNEQYIVLERVPDNMYK
ncbi:hypothetical protein [Tenacibaculum sp. 190524A02b]|uniref:Lipocalin-like domain-containing protein n=1 Tax=Tenacibaculum vairaonense TaxID=3137860 RepID=A0ABM9PIG3_9FLAO